MHNITTRYKEIKVWSASKFNLIIAIVFIVLTVLLEAGILHCIFTDKIGSAVLLQFMVSPITIVVASCGIGTYKRRKEFTLYFSQIDDVIDISRLKSEYHLCMIDGYGVLFIKNDDIPSYSDWTTFGSYNSTYRIEEKFFKNSTISFITKKED